VNPHQVHEAVKSAIAQTLYEIDRVNWRPANGSRHQESQNASTVAEPMSAFTPPGSVTLPSKQTKFNYTEGNFRQSATDDWQPATTNHQPEASSQRDQESIFDSTGFSALRVVGQLHNTYIVCESDAGLVLIDHHAAHERILFEQLQRRGADQQAAAQRLVVPETIELNFREAEILGQMLSDLKTFGLAVEPFGKNFFVIEAVPALLSGRDVKPMIHEIVEKTAAVGYSPGLKDVLDECRMVMACHGALRAHQALTQKQIENLLRQLDACDHPSHCPHGRPTWIRWDLATLEKSFKRAL
jgi:DNA mismatch repair protein MutL